ncbi:MAG: LytTR family transcriptional regulator DNA-binding domain-containing protein [Saprospiraceae bacterium]|nr:LytTR family transcriptional regulator DNA-binding domain-containing protein [Saprospiraceae bacterium]
MHKSYVVNASHIIEVMMTMETNVVKLSNGATLPISRRKNLFY